MFLNLHYAKRFVFKPPHWPQSEAEQHMLNGLESSTEQLIDETVPESIKVRP